MFDRIKNAIARLFGRAQLDLHARLLQVFGERRALELLLPDVALRLGRVDLWISDELNAVYLVRQAGEDPAKVITRVLPLPDLAPAAFTAFTASVTVTHNSLCSSAVRSSTRTPNPSTAVNVLALLVSCLIALVNSPESVG